MHNRLTQPAGQPAIGSVSPRHLHAGNAHLSGSHRDVRLPDGGPHRSRKQLLTRSASVISAWIISRFAGLLYVRDVQIQGRLLAQNFLFPAGYPQVAADEAPAPVMSTSQPSLFFLQHDHCVIGFL